MFYCVVVYFHDLYRICMNPLARQNRDKKKYSFSFHTRKKENPSPPNRSRNYDLPITSSDATRDSWELRPLNYKVHLVIQCTKISNKRFIIQLKYS